MVVILSNPLLSAPEIEEDIDYIPVQLSSELETAIPSKLKSLDIRNPHVKFKVVVDAKGEIADYLPIEASHHLLLDKAIEKLKEDANFIPAQSNGANAIGYISVVVAFYYPEQRAWKSGAGMLPMGGTVSDAVANKIYQSNSSRYIYEEAKVSELDSPLQIVDTKFHQITPEGEKPAKGSVMAEYYVDPKGEVRLTEILSSDDEYLSMSVLKTLKETQFSPPKREGTPTFVRVRQPFNFN